MLRKKIVSGLWQCAVTIAIPSEHATQKNNQISNKHSWVAPLFLMMALISGGVMAGDVISDAPLPSSHASQQVVIDHPGEKIDLFTGRLRLNHLDVELPGNGGFNIRVERTYLYRPADRHETLGLNWFIHFGRLKGALVGDGICNSNTSAEYAFETSSGDTHAFYRPNASLPGITTGNPSPPPYMSMSMWRMDCINNGAGGVVVTSPEGTRYELTSERTPTPSGGSYIYPSKITDAFGNSIVLTYIRTPSNISGLQPNFPLLSSVVASDGRKLTFSYNTDYLLSTITTDDGRTWTYSYQREPVYASNTTSKYFQLIGVVRPDGSKYTFNYHVQSGLITNATDPQFAKIGQLKTLIYPWGGSIAYDYTYASALGSYSTYYFRVLQTKTTSDGGKWTFSYAFAKKAGEVDVTTVATPDRSIVAKHYGYNSLDVPCWKTGLPISRTIAPIGGSAIETESYSWTSASLSSAEAVYPLNPFSTCSIGFRPQLANVQIVRDGTSYATAYSNFDAYGNPQTISETGNGQGKTMTRNYCTNGSKWLLRRMGGENINAGTLGSGAITRIYDATCTYLASESRFGAKNTFTWNTDGSLKTLVNPRGFTTTYSDYYRGIPRLESQPEGVSISRTVSSAGCVLSETNGEGKTTSYSCDGLNRQTRIARPVGSATTIAWAAASRTATRDQLTEITSYDGFGRARQQEIGPVSGTRTVRTYTYDANGRLTFESNPWQGAATSAGKRYTYDALDRVKTESAVDEVG